MPKLKLNLNQIVLMAIMAMAILLVVVIMIALFSGPQQTSEQPETNETTAPVGTQPTQPETPTYSYPESLTLNTALQPEMTVVIDKLVLEGACDPGKALLINGLKIKPNADGSFSHTEFLVLGENTITVSYDGQEWVYKITRRYALESCKPLGEQTYNGGATIYFKVSARANSAVVVFFNGQTITLKPDDQQLGQGTAEGFLLYTGAYKLPSTTSDKNMGAITYTVTCDGLTETMSSGTIICKKSGDVLASDPSVTPNYGNYIDVGSGYIAEIVIHSAETFNGTTNDDYSHTTNNYLPEGTVDYCSTKLVNGYGTFQYVVLRSGQRVYVEMRNQPTDNMVKVTDRYRGTLPDHNEINFSSMVIDGRHTILTLDCLWKAPFYFELLPQQYQTPSTGSDRNYSITSFTAEYVDITFCYATQFTGDITIPADNPIFKSAELIRRESDCTLRLYLKKTGGFYGWDCYYNENDQLCFQFLNPAKVTTANNLLGADLTGVKIVIDVGHGGSWDPGASGTVGGQKYKEAERNLYLALLLKEKLEAAGAEVILDRTTNVLMTQDERARILKQIAPDFCISIHHNAIDGHPEWGGFETFYFTPFAQPASSAIKAETDASGIYDRSKIGWHNFFHIRQTTCPVVLAENGYMSGDKDMANIADPSAMDAKALALAKGIANYFLSINQ